MKCNKKKLQVFFPSKAAFALFWTSKMECTLMLARWARFFFNRGKNAIYSPWLIIWRATYFFFYDIFWGMSLTFFYWLESSSSIVWAFFTIQIYTRGQSHAYFMRMFSQTFPPSLLSTFDYLFFFNSIDLKFYLVTCQFCERKNKNIFRRIFFVDI